MTHESFIQSARILAGAQYSSAAIGLLTTLIISRILGPEQFGFVAIVTSYTGLVWTFATFKTYTVTTRYIAGYYGSGKKNELGGICKLGFTIDFLCGLLILIVILVTASIFADKFLNKSFLAPYIVINALSIPFYSFVGTSRSIFLSLKKTYLAAFFLVVEKILVLATICLLLFTFRIDFSMIIIAQSLSHAVIGCAMLVAASVLLRNNGISLFTAQISSVASVFKEIRMFFAWNYLQTTISGIISQLPVLLLGKYNTVDEAGFYKIASSINTVFAYSENSLRSIAYPELSMRRERMSLDELLSFTRQTGKKYGLPLALLTILVLVGIVWILPLLFGDKYIEAIPVVQIMLVGSAVSAYLFWVESFYFTVGAFKDLVIQYAAIHIPAAALIALVAPSHGIILLAAIVILAKISFYILSSRRAGYIAITY